MFARVDFFKYIYYRDNITSINIQDEEENIESHTRRKDKPLQSCACGKAPSNTSGKGNNIINYILNPILIFYNNNYHLSIKTRIIFNILLYNFNSQMLILFKHILF